MKNVDEMSRKKVTFDNIKGHKKAGFHLSLEDTIFEKPQGGTEGKIDPLPSRLRDNSQPIANIFCLLRAMF